VVEYRPTATVPIVVEKRDDRARLVTTARWSLVPPFAESLILKYPTFNARSETVSEKPTFRGSVALINARFFLRMRVASALTEGKVKTPHAVTSPAGQLGVRCPVFVVASAPGERVGAHCDNLDAWRPLSRSRGFTIEPPSSLPPRTGTGG